MEIITVDLNNKIDPKSKKFLNLNDTIQAQQGDRALPIAFVFKYGTDTVDMSDGKVGFISGMTANNNNVEFENMGNSSGQCIITMNGYAFQDAGNYQYLYIGIKDSNGNVITSVPASLNVLENKLNTNLDTGAYRDDWQNFKNGLSSEVNSLDSSVSNAASQATSATNVLSSASSMVNSACSYVQSYATSATDKAVSQAQSAVNDMNNGVQTAINGMSENLNNQLAPFIGKQDAYDVLKTLGKTSLDDLPVGRYACNGWNSSMKGQYPTIDWISLDVSYDCTNGSKAQFLQTLTNGIYYRSQEPNSGQWTEWHHLGDDNSYVNNINMSDTNLMNGTSGTIKVQKLGNVVIINFSFNNGIANDVVYQLPSQFKPTAQRTAEALEVNSDSLYVDNIAINTDGTITIAQRSIDNSQVTHIDMHATFSYFLD